MAAATYSFFKASGGLLLIFDIGAKTGHTQVVIEQASYSTVLVARRALMPLRISFIDFTI